MFLKVLLNPSITDDFISESLVEYNLILFFLINHLLDYYRIVFRYQSIKIYVFFF